MVMLLSSVAVVVAVSALGSLFSEGARRAGSLVSECILLTLSLLEALRGRLAGWNAGAGRGLTGPDADNNTDADADVDVDAAADTDVDTDVGVDFGSRKK